MNHYASEWSRSLYPMWTDLRMKQALSALPALDTKEMLEGLASALGDEDCVQPLSYLKEVLPS